MKYSKILIKPLKNLENLISNYCEIFLFCMKIVQN